MCMIRLFLEWGEEPYFTQSAFFMVQACRFFMSIDFCRHQCSNMCQTSCQINMINSHYFCTNVANTERITRSKIKPTDLVFGSDCTCFGRFVFSVLLQRFPHARISYQYFSLNYHITQVGLKLNVELGIAPSRRSRTVPKKVWTLLIENVKQGKIGRCNRPGNLFHKNVLHGCFTKCLAAVSYKRAPQEISCAKMYIGKLGSRSVVRNWPIKTPTISKMVPHP